MTKTIIQLAMALLLMAPWSLRGQVVVGGTIPDPSALLDVQSSSQGVLLPRLTTTERDAIISPATGLTIFNTTTNCLEMNLGTPVSADWVRVNCRSGVVSMLDCGGAVVTGSLITGTSASGVSANVSYTGGNGGVYDALSVASTGVTGLTATLSAGNLASGAGTLTYSITGTPAGVGSASFALSMGGQSCNLDVTVYVPGSISALNCAGAVMAGLALSGEAASGVSASVPYTDGNGGAHSGQTVASTGVTGLTATLSAGNFASGAGNLSYAITGTPSSAGTASFALNIGGQTCTLNLTVVVPGSITALNCSGATVADTLTNGQAASGVSASVPYTGGDGGPYSGQTVSSTGITGLTATLSAGNFGSGAGSLSYDITGTPASAGTASFVLSIGGQTCTLDVFVRCGGCCAKVTATDYKDFMCYNLGAASNSDDPFTPSWEINGGYRQWGRSVQAAAGPTAIDSNSVAVTGWNTTDAANGSWADGTKTGNDPCPTGYRVPTKAQWDGVIANNTQTSVGTFNGSATNYEAGIKFGDQLMLPAAGFRFYTDGALYLRGDRGYYWSSTETGNFNGWTWFLTFSSSVARTGNIYRTSGYSVRCVADTPGAVGALDCSGATVTGTLTSGQAATGVSASVPYSGGNGGFHTGQTVTSTGVTGLTATLSAGNFGSGAGNLSYAITGTPASGGTARFALNIGGQTCTLDVTVSSAPVCRAKVTATDYKNFLCYNLGAANTSADPFTPSWEINGGYWQWGRSAEAAAGPTGPDAGQANSTVSGWNTAYVPNGSWAQNGTKTANDPCPAGYRVPTIAEWDGVVDNSTPTSVGTFTSSSATNYGAGKKFGDQLMLPAAGVRSNDNGALSYRGNRGYYWSSTESNYYEAWGLVFNSSGADKDFYSRGTGRSVRCVAE